MADENLWLGVFPLALKGVFQLYFGHKVYANNLNVHGTNVFQFARSAPIWISIVNRINGDLSTKST